MASSVSLDIAFHGHGWADFSITVEDKHDRVQDVSYLCDILEEIAIAGLLVACGQPALISFELEPGGEQYVLDYVGLDVPRPLRIRRFSFERLVDDRAAHEGNLEFEAAGINPDDFANAAMVLADTILQEHGRDGYSELWDRGVPFPSRAVEALRAALRAQVHISPRDREEEGEGVEA